MSIISISGKIGVGKDTVGKIIQYLILNSKREKIDKIFFEKFLVNYNIGVINYNNITDWQIKKFADKLKDIVCLLIGCTREQLEDGEFKNTELGKEWNYFTANNITADEFYGTHNTEYSGPCATYQEALAKVSVQRQSNKNYNAQEFTLTPRKILQLLGTECGRNIIHPNCWVNSLMSDYNTKKHSVGIDKYGYQTIIDKYPNWIITDTRFPNELQAVKDRGGISIRVDRIEKGKIYKIQDKNTKEIFEAKVDIDYRNYDAVVLRCKNNFVYRLPDYTILYENEHPSETALDDAEFDYYLDNNGTIEELIEKVREILIKEKLL